MKLIFSIINPYSIFYLLFNRPLTFSHISVTKKYFIQVFVMWIVLFSFTLLPIVLNEETFVTLFKSIWFNVLFLLFLMQTLSLITIPLKLYRLYITEKSIVQTWWFIKIIEIKKEDLFAVDITKEKNILSMHFFIKDDSLGSVIMERIISDVKTGFYIEVSEQFVNVIKATIDNNLLTKNVVNYPEISESRDLRKVINKISEVYLNKKNIVLTYSSLLLIHPFSIFLMLNFLSYNFFTSFIVTSLFSGLIDLIRHKIGIVFSSSLKKTPALHTLYDSRLPIEERIKIINT